MTRLRLAAAALAAALFTLPSGASAPSKSTMGATGWFGGAAPSGVATSAPAPADLPLPAVSIETRVAKLGAAEALVALSADAVLAKPKHQKVAAEDIVVPLATKPLATKSFSI